MRPHRLPLLLAVLLAVSSVQSDSPAPAGAAASTPGFDVGALDRAARPCEDFYQFACGGWMAANPVPSDQARWGRFDELAERNRQTLRSILEKAAAGGASRDPIDTMIGDHYASCMDEAGIEAAGLAPLKDELARISSLDGNKALIDQVARMHTAGVNVMFRIRSQQDFKDATTIIAAVDQGGLGLPDRDQYLKEDAKSGEIRAAYVEHVRKMLILAGDQAEAAASGAKAVMEFETALARVSLERVKRRDPANIYHPMPFAELAAMTPSVDWKAYLSGVAIAEPAKLNVAVPDFFKGLETQLASAPAATLKTYLRWHLLRAASNLLPSAFVNQSFDFYGKTLTGAKELRPRWKRCVDQADGDVGEALGRRYVDLTFGKEGKERMLRMVVALERALEADIRTLPWMTETTKKAALEKLHGIANKIGFPDNWRDYSTLAIARGDAVGNARRAAAFELRRQMAKIGKPIDRKEWLMSPPTVNAYYSAQLNDINFPAGILQPPFFDNAMDDAVNFGAIGAVIGHELTHGFDDQGRKFDASGNLRDWWSDADGKEFEARATCVADQYSGYTAVADVKLNGRLTLGENVADNGGVRIAYMALMETLAEGAKAPIDGFTPSQRLFLGWAQIWCQNRTDENARLLAQVDSHSPGRWRVNGVASNAPEFAEAFQCKTGDAMVRPNPCRVW